MGTWSEETREEVRIGTWSEETREDSEWVHGLRRQIRRSLGMGTWHKTNLQYASALAPGRKKILLRYINS